jgi:predicted GH43/DUF377 family glycosyl hydrolase
MTFSETPPEMWQRLGQVYTASGESFWRTSHAYLPTAITLSPLSIRVFVAFRDAAGRGRVGFVDVDASNPTRVLAVSERPCLDIGRPGAFDEHGVSPLCLIKTPDALYMYYAGWQLSNSVRYQLFTGLAKSADGGNTFARVSEAPILDRCDGELLIRSGGFVFPRGDDWVFAYMGGSEQMSISGKPTPTYDLMTLCSGSPLAWSGHGRLALSPRRPKEFGFGRPWILTENDRYRMWLSVRSAKNGYSITYAESGDGVTWYRDDNALTFLREPQPWESEMRSCASIIDTQAGRFMFYNGNAFGATGFGVARLADRQP